ncbi:MAG: TonB-dependent receptor [Bacteroidales bacterium]|nr:TonB-dependent receptor [Bacteroidales bacterium]
MRERVLTGLLVLAFFLRGLSAQEAGLSFSGSFQEVPFSEFATAVEAQTGTTIYYLDTWVRDLQVTLEGQNLSLPAVLDSILKPAGLDYYLDEWGHLFLTDGAALLSALPDYEGARKSPVPEYGELPEAVEEDLTLAEQKYINGRRVRVLEEIHVGSAEQAGSGRKALISGQIHDEESGEPLVGVTVYMEVLRKGASTASDGRFNFLLVPGTYGVLCQSLGMESLQFTMVVHSGGELKLEMKKTLIPLDEVVVTAGRHDHVSGNQMGYERLNYSVLKQVPLLMGERDILNVVKLLPGVQSVGEGSSGFNVRGSSADQNMIYINKVPVYNSSHLFGFFTAISPEIVRDFSLYKSNLPALYGGRLASFFDIQTRQGNMKRLSARAGISSVSAYAAVEGPLKKDKSSIALSLRSTYSDWILKLMEDPQLRESEAGFSDASGVYTWNASDRTRLNVFGYLSRDRFKLGTVQEYAYGNAGAALDVRHRFNQQISGTLALIYSRYRFRNQDTHLRTAGFEHESYIRHYELKSDFEWLSLGRHKLTFGGSGIYYQLDRGSMEPFGAASLRESLDLGLENGVETALYLADELTLTERLKVYAGFRFSSFFSLGPSELRTYAPGMPLLEENIADTLSFGRGELSRAYAGLEPRLNMRYLINDQASLKFSYNRGYQYLFILSNTVAMAPTDQWKLSDYHIGPQFMDQLSAGYYLDFPGSAMSASAEFYRKWGQGIVEYRDGASFTESPYVESATLQGKQKAYGVETMIRREAGGLNGWLSYTYSRSFMQVDMEETGEQINGGRPYPSNFDRPHNVSLVVNYKRGRRVSLSGNLVYMTGRPSTYPVAVYYEYELPYIHYSDRNKYLIPDYFRVDLSMNIEGSLRKHKRFHSFWMLGVYNVTGRKNAYSVFFQNESGLIRGYKLSIFARPIITVSWNVRLGNYASE